MNWNGFPSIFQKVQYFHSRHYKTTSHLLRISLNGILKLNELWPLEGAMYISLWENSRGHPDNVSFMQFSTKIDGFEQKDSQGFENSHNWTILIREIFNFHHNLPKLYLALRPDSKRRDFRLWNYIKIYLFIYFYPLLLSSGPCKFISMARNSWVGGQLTSFIGQMVPAFNRSLWVGRVIPLSYQASNRSWNGLTLDIHEWLMPV